MEWMMNRSPVGQWFAALGLGVVFGRHWDPWVGFVILCVGVGIGLVHHRTTREPA